MASSAWAYRRAQYADRRAVMAVLRNGMLADGTWVARLEEDAASTFGVPDAAVVASATAGLSLILAAHGVKPGSEVVTTPLTFPGTTNAIAALGARPVFVDCSTDGTALDWTQVENAITSRTSAVCSVGRLGPAALTKNDRGISFCRLKGIPAVEDGAYRFASVGTPIAAPTAISLHASKVITAGMGGLVVGLTAEKLQCIRAMRNQGIAYLATDRRNHTNQALQRGYALRLSDMNANLARGQLTRLPRILNTLLEARLEIAEALNDSEIFEFVPRSTAVLEFWIPIGTRKPVLEYIQRHKLHATIHYPLLSRATPWADSRVVGSLSNAEAIASRTISVAIPRNARNSDVRRTIRILRGAERCATRRTPHAAEAEHMFHVGHRQERT